MAIVAVVGDACTTTTVALASAWPASSEALIIEADPAGGDLAAWFDIPVLPSLSTVVTSALDASWVEIDRHTRLTPSGLRVIPAPPSAGEARHAVAQSAHSLAHVIREGTQEERDHYGEIFVRFLFEGPKRTGMLHADPHPGNYRVLPAADGIGHRAAIDLPADGSLPEELARRRIEREKVAFATAAEDDVAGGGQDAAPA